MSCGRKEPSICGANGPSGDPRNASGTASPIATCFVLPGSPHERRPDYFPHQPHRLGHDGRSGAAGIRGKPCEVMPPEISTCIFNIGPDLRALAFIRNLNSVEAHAPDQGSNGLRPTWWRKLSVMSYVPTRDSWLHCGFCSVRNTAESIPALELTWHRLPELCWPKIVAHARMPRTKMDSPSTAGSSTRIAGRRGVPVHLQSPASGFD